MCNECIHYLKILDRHFENEYFQLKQQERQQPQQQQHKQRKFSAIGVGFDD